MLSNGTLMQHKLLNSAASVFEYDEPAMTMISTKLIASATASIENTFILQAPMAPQFIFLGLQASSGFFLRYVYEANTELGKV